MDNLNKQPSKSSMELVDSNKLYALYDAGMSIRQISINWGLPYASVYRAIKKVEGMKKNKQ